MEYSSSYSDSSRGGYQYQCNRSMSVTSCCACIHTHVHHIHTMQKYYVEQRRYRSVLISCNWSNSTQHTYNHTSDIERYTHTYTDTHTHMSSDTQHTDIKKNSMCESEIFPSADGISLVSSKGDAMV